MAWVPEEISQKSKEDFEKTWLETAKLLPKPKIEYPLVKLKVGKPHCIFETAFKLREAFLRIGFDEIVLPVILDDVEIYKQYVNEAPAILDRCYYLAGLLRPDIGISDKKIQEIEKFSPGIEKKIDALQDVLRDYKKGKIEGDDLVEIMCKNLSISDITATRILNEIFPDYLGLNPVPTRLTLRSHMTTAWFGTLAALRYRKPLPIKLFTVDVRFRREQQEDPSHLRAHRGASCVIMDKNVTVETGKVFTEGILSQIGFENFRFVKKEVTAKYYAPNSEYEVFASYPEAIGKIGEIEVANFGLYSPVALSNYDLDIPVLNIGFGVERIAMITYGYEDIREMAYPQFYGEWAISDRDLAAFVQIDKMPSTSDGFELMNLIISKGLEYAMESSPCSFTIFEGNFLGKNIRVEIFEPDENSKLLGPAALNTIMVYDGNILGVPPTKFKGLVEEARERGISTRITYLRAIAALASSKIEEIVMTSNDSITIRVKVAKLPSDINIKIDEIGRRYITSKNKKIDIRGPVFIGIRAETI